MSRELIISSNASRAKKKNPVARDVQIKIYDTYIWETTVCEKFAHGSKSLKEKSLERGRRKGMRRARDAAKVEPGERNELKYDYGRIA